jgi:dUTP pyrophosphatase
MDCPTLKVKKLYDDTIVCTKKNPTDSGFDVYAHNWKMAYTRSVLGEAQIKADSDGEIPGVSVGGKARVNPGERILVGVGFAATVGPGWEIQVRPRSGVALHNGCTVLNTPGTVEIGVIFINHSNQTQEIDLGERIAQIVVAPVGLSELEIVDDLEETNRGETGYGDSGTKEH